MSSSPTPSIFLKVSAISHIEFCPKRSKIENFHKSQPTGAGILEIIRKGIKLHWQYSFPFKNFDRVLIRSKLKSKSTNKYHIFEKVLDGYIVVRGKYDDLRVIRCNGKKYVSLIEVKTTSKKYMWNREIKSAIRQLELYMWMLKEYLDNMGFPLWERSYVEIYSQKNGQLMKRIPVVYNDKIEDWIRAVVGVYYGLVKMNVPPFSYCKLCPISIKKKCDWYILRRSLKCVQL